MFVVVAIAAVVVGSGGCIVAAIAVRVFVGGRGGGVVLAVCCRYCYCC